MRLRSSFLVLELRGGAGGLAPLVQALPPDPHYRLALRSRHKAPWKLCDNSTTVEAHLLTYLLVAARWSVRREVRQVDSYSDRSQSQRLLSAAVDLTSRATRGRASHGRRTRRPQRRPRRQVLPAQGHDQGRGGSAHCRKYHTTILWPSRDLHTWPSHVVEVVKEKRKGSVCM